MRARPKHEDPAPQKRGGAEGHDDEERHHPSLGALVTGSCLPAAYLSKLFRAKKATKL
jgi:hypothetical protein